MRPDPTTDELPTLGKDGRTVELPKANGRNNRPETAQMRRETSAPHHKGRFWRELTGALAVGTVVLAAVVLVLQVIAWTKGMPGLGVEVLIGHLVGAGLVIVAQRIVDKRPGRPALLAGLGLCAVVAAILVLFWWI